MRCENPEEMSFLAPEIRRTANLIKRRLIAAGAEISEDALTGEQGVLLGWIMQHREQDVFQRDIEQAFKIRRSTATVLLQSMEGKEIICRTPVEYDARLKKIEVTEKGINYATQMKKSIDVMEMQLQTDITEEEKEIFLRVLAKINQNLGGGESCAWARNKTGGNM